MILINSVANALYTTLSSNQILVNCNVKVDFYLIENTNPNNMLYWINIMQPEVLISPWRSNITSPWKAEYNFSIISQVQAYNNVEDRFEPMRELDELNNNIFTAINCNRTLDNSVNIITGFNIAPFNRDDEQSDDFLMSQINVTAEVFA